MSHSSTLVAVVTGSNKGVGFAIVRKLCQEFKGHVYLTARNVQRGQEAIETLKSEGFDPKFHQLDIDSLSSIEELKSFVLEKYGGIDVLVNNAGIAYRNNSTASAIEQAMNTVKTNFTGTLNMMRAFAPIVHEHGRIVNVAAFNGHLSRLSSQSLRDRFSNPALTEEELMALMDEFITDVKEGKHLERGWCSTFYSTSKVGRIALTMVFAREMAKSGKKDILINACCPGWVRTDMAGPKAPLTPEQGAETPTMLALLPPGSPSGEFWKDQKVVQW